MTTRTALALVAAAALTVGGASLPATAAPDKNINLNVVLTSDITPAALKTLGGHGKVTGQLPQIDAVTMQARSSALPAIQALDIVAAANPDAKRVGKPVPTSPFSDTSAGYSMYSLDQIDVRGPQPQGPRQVGQTGEGVYVAVLDTGLFSSWRYYFGEDAIASEYAMAFGGGGGKSSVSQQPNKWQTDTQGHGTHVTSTILGFNLHGTAVDGVAPKAKVIPVKVLNNNGSGQSAVVAAGITYVADLKLGPLADSPVVINMSLGGSELDAVEKAALDYALDAGVLIVASAGNSGEAGMGYPGAYAPVISVAATGWTGEWRDPGNDNPGTWWYAGDVAEKPEVIDETYISDFSSRELEGQELDVAAPGAWVLGAYQVNQGQQAYYYLGGTSMAAPHVAGLVALLAEKAPDLTQAQAEGVLTGTALPIPAGCRDVLAGPGGPETEVCWGEDATGHGLVNAVDALAALD